MHIDIETVAGDYRKIHWVDVASRKQLIPTLDDYVLLHAGPPHESRLPAAVRNAAIQAILYEGLADNESDALHGLERGRFEMRPAQDYGVVTPLAQVVSASMPLAVVSGGDIQRFAPLIEAGAPALRFGVPSADARARLRLFDHFAQAVLRPALQRSSVSLEPVIRSALLAGQECHALTDAANQALIKSLHLAACDSSVIAAYAGFVLPIVMAACSVRLEHSSPDLIAVGGNGTQFGYKLRYQQDWQVIHAEEPRGTRWPAHDQTPALGAIGDSAVVDFAGLGAQAMAACPSLLREWQAHLPEDMLEHRRNVLHARRRVVSLSAVRANGQAPLVNLAILDNAGESGLIGRGVYQPAAALFG